MRVVVALGGNALLRRGEEMTSENQRENVRVACDALAPVAMEHELVVSHGNGPQVGLLALQGAAYEKVPTYPLDVLGAETQGMIGCLVEQELGNRLPFERPLATLLTMIEVDPGDRVPWTRQTDRTDLRPAADLKADGDGRSSSTATPSGASSPRPSPSASSSCARSSGCSSTRAW
jgi:carbamate kinase